MKRALGTYDIIIAPMCEAALLLLAGIAAMLLHKPLFFASLGPTAYELAETPERQSARPYSVIVGHLVGVVSGFFSLWITHAWYTPAVTTSGITWARVWASVIATLLTVFGTMLLKATQPAALSTTLMVATGSMQRLQDAPIIMAAIILLTIAGEPLRRWRHTHKRRQVEQGSLKPPANLI
ncbi:HPP family protein [Terriglobus sp.]|uniref:HPP family protein n=1 Tax=Terriglobus sp. TaxID=1889013 RepID=UPI003AFFE369